MEHIHIRIDEKIKKQVQLKALEKGSNLTEIIKKLLIEWLKK